jgi:hypothetical protein
MYVMSLESFIMYACCCVTDIYSRVVDCPVRRREATHTDSLCMLKIQLQRQIRYNGATLIKDSVDVSIKPIHAGTDSSDALETRM